MKLQSQNLLNDIISGQTSLNLKISDENGLTVGEMVPLNKNHLNDPEMIQLLTDWRNRNMEYFLSQFVATPERTHIWMRDVLFKKGDQLLFLIRANEKLVGHFGFKNLTTNHVLLDNAMRGSRDGHPKLFTFAGKVLVDWLIRMFSIERIDAYVMVENVASIMMSKQIGFKDWHKYPLIKEVTKSGINWKMGAKNGLSSDLKYCYKSEILTNTLAHPYQ